MLQADKNCIETELRGFKEKNDKLIMTQILRFVNNFTITFYRKKSKLKFILNACKMFH